MEPEEIAIVLSRSSELHSKLNLAIDRLFNAQPPSLSPSSSSPPPPLALDGLPNDPSSVRNGLQNGISPFDRPLADGPAEVRSLASIREALEALEENLEALQALQQQQRAERDAGLAEIEESRRVLLRRLKEHRGRESEIVQEALAFAGGSVADNDDLPLPPYPKVYDDESPRVRPVSAPSRRSRPGQRSDMAEEPQDRSEVLDFEVEEAQEDDEGSDGDLEFQYEEENEHDRLLEVAMDAANAVKNSGAFAFAANAVKSSVALLGYIADKITGQVTGPSSKVVLIVVSTLAVLSLTDIGERRRKSVSRVSKTPAHRSHYHHIGDLIPPDSSHIEQAETEKAPQVGCIHQKNEEERPYTSTVEQPSACDEKPPKTSGTVKLEDEFPKCVVRERLELPFYQELRSPDVLYGRG